MTTRRIGISFSKDNYTLYLGINVSRRLGARGLLKIIKAEDLIECIPHNGHVNFNDSYRKTGRLEDREKYLVRTNNLDKTLDSIKSYKNQQE